MKMRRYLTIHFAPSTACVVFEIDESKARELTQAMHKHTGPMTLKVSTHTEVSTTLDSCAPPAKLPGSHRVGGYHPTKQI